MKNAGVKDSATTLANGVRADGPELVIGVVGAVGTDLALVLNKLRESLTDVSYYVPEPLHLIEALHQIERWKEVAEVPLDVRIDEHMNMGNTFREEVGLGESVALLGGVAGIRRERKSGPGETEDSPVPRCAYLLRSLKHHDEVETLRRIYGSAFLLVAAHSPLETRLDRLASEIAESYHVFQTNKYRAQAAHLNQRDESEPDKKFGQNVRKTFPLADVFIDASDPTDLGRSVKRFVELLFGYQFHTPTRDEFAMFHAQAAALRSASLGRQVGAVVVTKDGDIIAVGTNEVPKASGGLYWAGDSPDHRDFTLTYDTNDRMKRNILGDLLKRLQDANWLEPTKEKTDVKDLVNAAVAAESGLMKDAQVMNLIEFGRSVHAEMAALIDAARRGVAVEGCSLYTTTFPCHDCAKHIVAAGIPRVVYMEPYPKSLAPELYLDSIDVDGVGGSARQVTFQPFVGVAPRRYIDLFTMVDRKDMEGNVLTWNKSAAVPRFQGLPQSYLLHENNALASLYKNMEEKGLRLIT